MYTILAMLRSWQAKTSSKNNTSLKMNYKHFFSLVTVFLSFFVSQLFSCIKAKFWQLQESSLTNKMLLAAFFF